MKKIINFFTSCALYAIFIFTTLASFFCGVAVANLLKKIFEIPGLWCLLLVPIVLAVGLFVQTCFINAMRKFGDK